MKRTPLSIGSNVQAKGGSFYTYVIDCVIGDGASSIVYEAHYVDSAYGRHDVRLKECYPYASDIQRIGTELVWADAATATSDKVAFTTAYHKLLEFQNTSKLRNSTAHIFDLCEANGTLYSVMDVNEGKTFELDDSEKLSDILKTTFALARAVEKYHSNGYLHLDIKPSNFLVIPETRELVILFDLDSVTAMEDIASGKVKCVSYSKSWAAPEQIQGRIDKLCPATDIYSIGAILFQKVMGRAVENEDIGIFADWDFNGELFEKVNPKIKRLLREMFRKTLAANIKRRYQSVDALISALEASVECVRDGAPYLVSDCPNPNKNFLGREKELADIAAAFKNGKKTVFLHGFGGIGKSELAKKYAELHEKEYDAVLFLSYEDSLEDLLDDIQIQNCDVEEKRDKIKILQKVLSDQRVLLIVDNFDVEIDHDDYLDTFLRLKADKIFTTRTDFSDIADNKTRQINIGSLSSKELVSLFEKESAIPFSNEDRVVIDEILKTYNYYTLIVPIFAKYLVSSGCSLEALREKTKQGLRVFEDTEKVAVAKDGRTHRMTGLDMMRATFRMVGLSDLQCQVLKNLYIVRFTLITKQQYREYLLWDEKTSVMHIDAINDLLYLGWIQKEITGELIADLPLRIHPIIQELIEIELNPTIVESEFVGYIQNFVPWDEFERPWLEGIDEWGPLYRDSVSDRVSWLCKLADSNLNNNSNFQHAIDTLYRLINGNVYIIDDLFGRWELNALLEKIKKFDDSCFDAETRFKLYNILEVYYACILINERYRTDDRNRLMAIRDDFQKYFLLACDLIDKLNDFFKMKAIASLCKLIYQVLPEGFYDEDYRASTWLPKDICEVAKKHVDVLWDSQGEEWRDQHKCIPWDSLDYDVLNRRSASVVTEKKAKEECTELDKEKDGENYYSKKYDLGYDIDEIVEEIMADDRFDNEEKAGIFSDLFSFRIKGIDAFCRFQNSEQCTSHQKNIDRIDWKRLLQISEKFLSIAKDRNFGDYDPYNEVNEAKCGVIYANAMLGNFTKLQETLEWAATDFIISLDKEDEWDAEFWKSVTCFGAITDLGWREFVPYRYPFGSHANICRNLRMCHLVVPWLLHCTRKLEEKIKEEQYVFASLLREELKYAVRYNGNHLDLMYSWYREIAEFSFSAAIEIGVTTKDGAKYVELYQEYYKKLCAILENRRPLEEEIQFFKTPSYESIVSVLVDYYSHCYWTGEPLDALLNRIQSDPQMTKYGVLSVCDRITYNVFCRIPYLLPYNLPEFISRYNWADMETILDFQEEYSSNISSGEFKEEELFSASLMENNYDMRRVLLDAILDQKELFDIDMCFMFDLFKRNFEERKADHRWWHFSQFERLSNVRCDFSNCFCETMENLQSLQKHEWLLPYLVECAEYIHDWLKTLPDYDERMMYSWYKAIVDCAFEVGGICKAYYDYSDKIERMTPLRLEDDLKEY